MDCVVVWWTVWWSDGRCGGLMDCVVDCVVDHVVVWSVFFLVLSFSSVPFAPFLSFSSALWT